MLKMYFRPCVQMLPVAAPGASQFSKSPKMGVLDLDGGAFYYNGENLAGLKPHQIFRKGITRTFQIVRIYREMTVFENMLSVSKLSIPEREARARAEELMEFARALMTDPDLILLDEPAGVINPTLLQSLLSYIHKLQERGKTILIIEHNMNVIMNHCEKIFVMDYGGQDRQRSSRGDPGKRTGHQGLLWTQVTWRSCN